MLSVDPGAMTRMLDRLACKGWIERLPNPADKRGVLVQLTRTAQPFASSVIRLWVEVTPGVNEKSVGGRSRRNATAQEGPAVKIRRGKMMSRRNNDAITIHSILSWIDNLESPLSLEKVSERSGYSKWHLQRMFKKETGHSLSTSAAAS